MNQGNKQTLRILVADDVGVNRELLTRILVREGYRVDAVADGADVLRRLQQAHFDLVILDIQMPGMDGVDTALQIRTAGNQIPILGLTSHYDIGDRDKYLHAGMNSLMTKPVRRSLLRKEIYRLLPQLAQEGLPDVDQALMREVQEDLGEERWQQLLQQFQSHAQKYLCELDQAQASGNLQDMEDIAHRIAGMAHSLGFVELGNAAVALCDCIKGRALERSGDCLQKLKDAYARDLGE